MARVLAIRDGAAAGPLLPYERDAVGAVAEQAQNRSAPPVEAGVTLREARVRADFALRP